MNTMFGYIIFLKFVLCIWVPIHLGTHFFLLYFLESISDTEGRSGRLALNCFPNFLFATYLKIFVILHNIILNHWFITKIQNLLNSKIVFYFILFTAILFIIKFYFFPLHNVDRCHINIS